MHFQPTVRLRWLCMMPSLKFQWYAPSVTYYWILKRKCVQCRQRSGWKWSWLYTYYIYTVVAGWTVTNWPLWMYNMYNSHQGGEQGCNMGLPLSNAVLGIHCIPILPDIRLFHKPDNRKEELPICFIVVSNYLWGQVYLSHLPHAYILFSIKKQL